jgi:hypothetical protein
MNKVAVSLAVATSLLALAAGNAWSGYKQVSPVSVNLSYRYASGSLGSTRNSADTQSYLSCYTYASPTDAGPVGVCVAYNGSVSGSCLFQNKPALASVVQSLSSDSWVYFAWDASNQCTMIQVDNGSYSEPKK